MCSVGCSHLILNSFALYILFFFASSYVGHHLVIAADVKLGS